MHIFGHRHLAALAAATALFAAGPASAEDGAPDAAAPRSLEDLKPRHYFDEPALKEALKDFLRGRNLPAARKLRDWLSEARPADPRRLPARFLELLALHDGGECDPTAEHLEAFAQTWPLFADYALMYAGSCHVKLGADARAVATLTRVPTSSTVYPRAAELLAEALERSGNRAAAITTLQMALKHDPNDRSESWKLLAELTDKAGDEAAHREALLGMTLHFPDSVPGRAARKALGGARKLTPEENLRLGRALFTAHLNRQAARSLKRAADGHPRFSEPRCEALVLLARTYEKLKRRTHAWRLFDRALGCKGRHLAVATFSGGRNRLRAGHEKAAEELLRRHMELFPHDSTADDAAWMIAMARRERGDEAGAREALQEILKKWPDGDMVDQAAWDLVWPDVDAGRWARVVERAGSVLDAAPRETHYRAEGRVRYWYGRALQKIGRKADATKAYQRVVVEHPLSWYGVLAWSRLQKLDRAAAKAALKEAQARSDKAPDPLATTPAALWKDPHFARAVELARMGIRSSSRRELAAVGDPPDGVDAQAWRWNRIAVYDMAGAYAAATTLARQEEPNFGRYLPAHSSSSRKLWELAHPRAYQSTVTRWASKRNIDPNWVWSIGREESNFNPGAVSWAGAVGVMQIIMPTARLLARRDDLGQKVTRDLLKRSEVSIRLGSRYLALLEDTHAILPLASAGYNAGNGAVKGWRKDFGKLELDRFVERIPYDEARGYAKRVTRSVARYTWLYEGKHITLPLGRRVGRAR